MQRLWSQRLVQGIALALAIGLFLSFVGAYGSGQAPFLARTPWFLGFTLFGGILAVTVVRWSSRAPWLKEQRWRRFLFVAGVMALLMGSAVWFLLPIASGDPMALSDLPRHAVISIVSSLAMTGLGFAVFRAPVVTHAAPAGAAPPRFLARLPAGLKGADVWAVEAEDHYLRIHTSRGSDLILMRLADAVAELEGIEGAQTHRSWWVARSAVREVKRGDGRATFVLPDGKEAPVSRTYARTLRAAGWF